MKTTAATETQVERDGWRGMSVVELAAVDMRQVYRRRLGS